MLGALPRRILTLERVRLFWSQRVAVNCGNASARFMCVQTRKPLTCHFNEIFKRLVKMCLLGRGLSVGAKESQAEAWIQGSDGDRRGDWIEICCEEAPASATQSEGTGTMSCPGFIVTSRTFLEDVGTQWERRMFGLKNTWTSKELKWADETEKSRISEIKTKSLAVDTLFKVLFLFLYFRFVLWETLKC